MLGPHGPQRFDDAAFDLLGRQAHVRGTEGHVLLDRRHEELVVGVLEDDADGLADDRQRPGRDGDAAHDDPPLGRQQQPVGVQQQGRLAGAVGAD